MQSLTVMALSETISGSAASPIAVPVSGSAASPIAISVSGFAAVSIAVLQSETCIWIGCRCIIGIRDD